MNSDTEDIVEPDRTLELTGAQMQRLVDAVMLRLGSFLDTLPVQPAWTPSVESDVMRGLMQPLPVEGQAAADILRRLFDEIIPLGLNSAGPGYLAYVPGGGLPEAAVADLISSTVNRYIGLWHSAPGLAQLEVAVLRWFCDIVGYPPQSGGFFTSGGSLSNWSALVTARGCRPLVELTRGMVYTSDQAHHCVRKAAMLAGFPAENVRTIEVDAEYRIRLDRLRDQIQRDRREARQPLAIVGQAGTTNTGAVDDLEGLADLARAEDMWLHVDASYGGFFMLTARGQEALRGLHRADSITLDPHKSLFLPYGTGCLLVRDQDHLRQTHRLRGEYLMDDPDADADDQANAFDFSDISPELTRPCRGLRVWLPMQLHGIEPFRRNLDEKLDLTAWVTAGLRELNEELADELEIMTPPQLTIVAFRLVRAGLEAKQLDDLNRRFLEAINASRQVLLTATRLHGRNVIRICILSFRTHRSHVETCLREIVQAARTL